MGVHSPIRRVQDTGHKAAPPAAPGGPDGPGGIEQISQSPFSVRLYNFGIGRPRPDEVAKPGAMKSEFLPWLRKVAWMLNRSGSATIVGMASYTGQEQTNMELSKRRALATMTALHIMVDDVGKRAKIKLGLSRGWASAAAAGDKYGTEDPRFRSVVVTAWLLPDPPPPKLPDLTTLVQLPDIPDTLGHVFDGISLGEGVISTGISLAELITEATVVAEVLAPIAAVVDVLFLIGGLLFTWIKTGQLAHLNGWVRGFVDSMQDMAGTYRDPHLDPTKPETWPALPHPTPGYSRDVRESNLKSDEQENRAGWREGCDKAFEVIQDLDTNPSPTELTVNNNGKDIKIKVTGKVLLAALWPTSNGDVKGKFLELINRKLREQGKGSWPLLD